MGYKFNPFTGNLDTVDSPNGVFEEIDVNGDITLDDGGTFTTTLQTVTATANRTISFPDATGTVALVAGSSGQLLYNASGANAGTSTITYDGTNVTLTGRFISSLNGAASAPPGTFTGTWFTGGTSTTTKPQVVIEPTGTTSTSWSTSGTGLGVNAASGFAGNLLDLQLNGTSLLNTTTSGASGGQIFRVQGVSGANYTEVLARFTTPGAGTQFAILGSGTQRGALIGPLGSYGWANTSVNPTVDNIDLYLNRDAAGTLAQRNGTNAQTFRVYGTYTDASNHVRAALSSTSTAVTLAAETAGTGADDIPLNLTAAGTGTIKVNSVAEVVVSSTVAGLPAAPVVGMLTRVTDATAPVVGMTVAGGGAAAALCWYNGANWSVIGV
jgi:hypothetical protein